MTCSTIRWLLLLLLVYCCCCRCCCYSLLLEFVTSSRRRWWRRRRRATSHKRSSKKIISGASKIAVAARTVAVAVAAGKAAARVMVQVVVSSNKEKMSSNDSQARRWPNWPRRWRRTPLQLLLLLSQEGKALLLQKQHAWRELRSVDVRGAQCDDIAIRWRQSRSQFVIICIDRFSRDYTLYTNVTWCL